MSPLTLIAWTNFEFIDFHSYTVFSINPKTTCISHIFSQELIKQLYKSFQGNYEKWKNF